MSVNGLHERAFEAAKQLAALKFYPVQPEAIATIARIIASMASECEQIDWLVQRALTLWNEWPGPRALRALFCERFRPADGVEAA